MKNVIVAFDWFLEKLGWVSEWAVGFIFFHSNWKNWNLLFYKERLYVSPRSVWKFSAFLLKTVLLSLNAFSNSLDNLIKRGLVLGLIISFCGAVQNHSIFTSHIHICTRALLLLNVWFRSGYIQTEFVVFLFQPV